MNSDYKTISNKVIFMTYLIHFIMDILHISQQV